MAEQPVDPDELERLGLFEPDDEHAAERLELVAYLLGLGATIDDLVASRDDYFGPVVNLATRAVELADPGCAPVELFRIARAP